MSETNGNHYRGDQEVTIGGQAYTFRIGWQQFAALERLFNLKGWTKVTERAQEPTSDEVIKLFRILVGSHHPQFNGGSGPNGGPVASDEMVGELIEKMSLDVFMIELQCALASFAGGPTLSEQIRRKHDLTRRSNAFALKQLEEQLAKVEAQGKAPAAPSM